MKDYVKYKVDEELSSLSADDDMWAKILEKSDEVLDERADNLISREYFAKRGSRTSILARSSRRL